MKRLTKRQAEVLADVATGRVGRSRRVHTLYETWDQGRNISRQVRALQACGLIELDWEAARTAYHDPWRLTVEGAAVLRRLQAG